jgi:hypothetical protein
MGKGQAGTLEKEEIFKSTFEIIDEIQAICNRIEKILG